MTQENAATAPAAADVVKDLGDWVYGCHDDIFADGLQVATRRRSTKM